MTAPTTQGQAQNTETVRQNDKELNFRQQEKALQDKYERALAQERHARMQAEQEVQKLSQQRQSIQEDEDDSEPYVGHKKLNKTLSRFGENTQQEIKKGMESAKELAKEELKQEIWLESNSDFHDILESCADKFFQKSPALANSILKMPPGFERNKLVYENIKALGLHKPEVKQSSIQDKIDSNKRSPYYQPSGIGTAPYASGSDFSQQGKKQAYDKMQELKRNLKL